MKTPQSFTPEEVALLERTVGTDLPTQCPACGARLDQRAVPPRADVGYVRDRIWLVCPGCHRTAVLDRRARKHP